MNTESNKLQKKQQKMTKELKKETNIIENEEEKFNEYSNNQKIKCKEIEATLTDLIVNLENLSKEE